MYYYNILLHYLYIIFLDSFFPNAILKYFRQKYLPLLLLQLALELLLQTLELRLVRNCNKLQ